MPCTLYSIDALLALIQIYKLVLTQCPHSGMEGWYTGDVAVDGAQPDGEGLEVGDNERQLHSEEFGREAVLGQRLPRQPEENDDTVQGDEGRGDVDDVEPEIHPGF